MRAQIWRPGLSVRTHAAPTYAVPAVVDATCAGDGVIEKDGTFFPARTRAEYVPTAPFATLESVPFQASQPASDVSKLEFWRTASRRVRVGRFAFFFGFFFAADFAAAAWSASRRGNEPALETAVAAASTTTSATTEARRNLTHTSFE
jgi:hypothetical protein